VSRRGSALVVRYTEAADRKRLAQSPIAKVRILKQSSVKNSEAIEWTE